MACQVITPTFSGPFELLLQLVRREQVELYDISISDITEAYLAELGRMQHCDLEVATEFLLIAAILMEMKARRMLPEPVQVDLDEEVDAVSERDLLLARMVECATFRSAAAVFQGRICEAQRSRPRRVGIVEERWLEVSPPLLDDLSPEELREAYRRAVVPAVTPSVDVAHITPIEITVGEAVEELADRLRASGPITFRRLTSGINDRLGLVVRFLAVLEMLKQDLVDVEQADTFGEIVIKWTGQDTALQTVGAGVDVYGV